MALIACPECQAQISSQAPTCPGCGYPMKRRVAPVPLPVPPPASRTGARPWFWLLLGYLGVPLLAFALIFGGGALFNYYEREQLRSKIFTNLVEKHIPEAEVAGSGTLPKILARFNPKAPGKLVRVKLEFNKPYEFPMAESGKTIFKPSAELQIVRDDSETIVGQTSMVEWRYVPSMHLPPKGMQQGVPSEMVIEFEPADTNTYRIEFKAPEKGFERYKLLVEQKGL